MREIKNLVWVFLAAILLATAMAGVGMSSSSVVMYVDPQYSVVAPDGMFDVYVTVSDVVDLFLAELHISFAPALLEVYDDPLTPPEIDIEGINPGVVAPNCEKIHVERLDNEAGWLGVVAGRPLGVKTGLTGTVQVARITFRCKMEGFGDIQLYDTGIKNIHGTDIEHTTEVGYAINTVLALDPPILWIRRKGAHGGGLWPLWETAVWTEGLTNTISSRIKNTGDSSVRVKVKVTITGPLGIEPPIWTDIKTIAGRDGGTPGEVTVSADFSVPATGKYYMQGVLYFEPVPDVWVPWPAVQGVFGGEGLSRYNPGDSFKAA